jgi:hypothetical protein
MDVDEIRAVRNARPFGRFTLELGDGTLIPVEKPHHLAISPQGKELTYVRRLRGYHHVATSKVSRILPGIVDKKAG